MTKKLRCYRCGRVLAKIDLETGVLELKCSRSRCARINAIRISHGIGAQVVPQLRPRGAAGDGAPSAEPRELPVPTTEVGPLESREGLRANEGAA